MEGKNQTADPTTACRGKPKNWWNVGATETIRKRMAGTKWWSGGRGEKKRAQTPLVITIYQKGWDGGGGNVQSTPAPKPKNFS